MSKAVGREWGLLHGNVWRVAEEECELGGMLRRRRWPVWNGDHLVIEELEWGADCRWSVFGERVNHRGEVHQLVGTELAPQKWQQLRMDYSPSPDVKERAVPMFVSRSSVVLKRDQLW